MDTQHVANQVTNIDHRNLPQIDTVYVMVGTYNKIRPKLSQILEIYV